MSKIVFADTETTGLDPARHHAYEIGLIVRGQDEPDTAAFPVNGEWRFWLDVDLSTADPFALKVGRYFERRDQIMALLKPGSAWVVGPGRKYATSLSEAAQQVHFLMRDSHVVGAMPWFDAGLNGTGFIDKFLRQHNQLGTWSYHLLDIEAMLIGYRMGLWAEANGLGLAEDGPFEIPMPWQGEDLFGMFHLVLSEDEKHTALGDARGVERAFDLMRYGLTKVPDSAQEIEPS